MLNRMIQIKGRSLTGGLPVICAPMTGRTLDELFDECTEVKKTQPGLVEWRADYLTEETPPYVTYAARIRETLAGYPLMFTLRTYNEGGQKELAEDVRLAAIISVLESRQVDLIDIELSAGRDFIAKSISVAHANGSYVIVSHHNFLTTPGYEEIISKLSAAKDTGADMVKIAVTPQTSTHVLTLLAALNTFHKENDLPVIAISMGQLGVASRVAGHVFGSAVTYASLTNASAPGQISISDMKTALKIFGIAQGVDNDANL